MNKYRPESKQARMRYRKARMCTNKTAYPTEAEAMQKGQRHYSCAYCQLWHRSGSLATLVAKCRGAARLLIFLTLAGVMAWSPLGTCFAQSSTNMTTQVAASVQADQTLVNGLRSSSDRTRFSFSESWTYGDGSRQAERVYASTRTLSGGAAETLDVSDFGGVADAFGRTYSLNKIRTVAIRNTSTHAHARIGKAASARWTSWCPGATDSRVDVRPGGILLLIAGDTNGFSVANTTNDKLLITNATAANTLTYEILVVGSE